MFAVNAMSLKAHINKYAIENKILPQHALQSYLIQRFLVRLVRSRYRDCFVLKGGLLISTVIGLKYRTTMDIDATTIAIPMVIDNVKSVMEEIAQIDGDDPFTFRVNGVTEINEHNNYPGLRVDLSVIYEKINAQVLIDLTTGDSIIPCPMTIEMPLMFEDAVISLKTYTLETVLAEKLETIISRGELNSRPRDFYDAYVLVKSKMAEISSNVLTEAVVSTFKMRNTSSLLLEVDSILENVRTSLPMIERWKTYQKKFAYARNISFDSTIEAVCELFHIVVSRVDN